MISLIHAASSQFQRSFGILGHICIYIYIYPDFNASIVIVVIVEVVAIDLLTGDGVWLGGQN